MFQAFHRRFTPIECQWLQFTNYIHRQADLLKLAARMCLGTLGTWWRPQRQKNGCILGSESSWSHPNVSNGAERTLWTDLILAGSQNGRVWSHRKIFPNENHGFSTWSSWPVSSSHLACQGWKTASMWMSSCEVWEHSWASGVLLSQRYLFPTCQMRVVRFYQSCSSPSLSSPPPPPPLHPLPGPLPPLPCPLPPCQFFAKLFANFRAQWALLDLNCRLPIWVGTAGPQPQGSERSGHRWTSTSGAQWAPLDLNLGPSELSEHRWTSTWDPPSSVSTAGPQPGTLRAQSAPLDLNGQIECQKICQIERQIDCQKECQKICQIKCPNVCQIECQKICQIECQKVCQIECQIECQKVCQIKCQNVCQIERQKICQIECQIECQKICQIECQKVCQIECQIECQKVCQIKCQNVCQNARRYAR